MTRDFNDVMGYAQEQWHSGRAIWRGLCQKFCRTAAGAGGGNASAWDQWKNMPAAHKHPGGHPDDAPEGSALFFKGSAPYGHVMLAKRAFPSGRKSAWSNDLVRSGAIDPVLRTDPTTHWGQGYLGYGTQLNGVNLDVNRPANHEPAHKAKPKRELKTIYFDQIKEQFLAAATGKRVEQRGGVAVVQGNLNRRLHAGLKVDGRVGEKTLDAWYVWEKSRGVEGRPRVPNDSSDVQALVTGYAVVK